MKHAPVLTDDEINRIDESIYKPDARVIEQAVLAKLTQQKPIVYMVFSENDRDRIRMWSYEPTLIQKMADAQGLQVVNLYAAPMPTIKSEIAEDISEIDRLKAELAKCKSEAAHWKSNHETEVRRARILKERPDMPIERVQAYEKWGKDQIDAVRWQFLESSDNYKPCVWGGGEDNEWYEISMAQLDAAIAEQGAALQAVLAPNGDVSTGVK